MSDVFQIQLWLTMAALLLVIKFWVHGLKDYLFPICLFYFYFSFGPVINYLIGETIYFGIPVEYIPQASLIFLLGIGTLVITSLIIPPPKKYLNPLPPEFKLVTLSPIMWVSLIYALYIIVMIILSGGNISKIQKIAMISPVAHYSYLMIQIYVVSFFFVLQRTSLWKLYLVNFITYILYSVALDERDFIFPIISIMIHHYSFQVRQKMAALKLVIGSTVLSAVGVSMFFFRDASQSFTGVATAALNQGSLLFINTFTLKLLHERIDFFLGFTYLNSILNLLPRWIYKTDFNTLDWFKDHYAARSDSGYGFALDAEGYLNFSYFGVVLTFFIITLVQRKIAYNLNKHSFFPYFSVFFTAFTMYSLRNDSLAFIKGNLYGVMFFIMVYQSSKFISKVQSK